MLTIDDGSLVPGVSNHDDPGWEDGKAARAARVGEAQFCDRRATRGDGCHPPSVLEVFWGLVPDGIHVRLTNNPNVARRILGAGG